MRGRRRRGLTLIGVALLLVAGCSSGGAGAPSPNGTAPSASAPGGSAPGGSAPGGGTPGGSTGADPVAATRPAPIPCATCWHPPVRTSWNWVLAHVPHAPFRPVSMYDVDGFEATAADVTALHRAGIKATCYLSAGSWESWRPDAARFPAALRGRPLDGWPGERWLDVRDVRRPHSRLLALMLARLDLCHSKGFDLVELDNVDGFANDTGFPISAADQIFFDATLANAAHARGLSVLQKNDGAQIPQLLPYFDGGLDEQCNQYQECTRAQTGGYGWDQYVAAGKPVFQVEYQLATSRFCPADNRQDFNGIRLALSLNDTVFQPCR